MEKPKRCCHPNCSECPYKMCRWDCDCTGTSDIENYARYQKAHLDGKGTQYDYNHSERGKERNRRYNQSEKRKESQRRYNHSEKGKSARGKYLQSEKGRAMLERKQRRAIESGKNAERCRRYYQKKKAAELAAMV